MSDMNDYPPPGPTPGTIVAPPDPGGGVDVHCRRAACGPPHGAAIARDGPQAERFAQLLGKHRFVPAAGIRATLATGSARVRLDAFVQPIGDSLIGQDGHGRTGIVDALTQAAAVARHGGAVGIDFSPLRPRGARVAGSPGCRAAGPAAYLRLFEQLHHTVRGPDAMRGSLTATLAIDHPDLLRFLAAPAASGARPCVALTDGFMRALRDDTDVDRAPPAATACGAAAAASRGSQRPTRQQPAPFAARDLWQGILRQPGGAPLCLAFVDSGQAPRGAADAGQPATAVLPAGPLLPPYGAVAHGNLALPAFLASNGAGGTRFDWVAFGLAVAGAVEFLDRVLDVTACPLPHQQVELQNKRPISLGCGGLADTLAALGLRPGSEEGVDFARRLWTALRDGAVLASVELARERGAYALFDADRELGTGRFGATLPPALQAAIRRHGIRNARLLFAWLADDRGPRGMTIEARLLTLAAVAPLVDGGTALPLRIPRDCALEGAAAIVLRAWQAGARSILLHR